MIDVKKLITGFLVLAIAAGTSSVIFSVVGPSAPTNVGTPTAQLATVTAANDPSTTTGDNAFLSTQTQDQGSNSVSITTDDASGTASAALGASDPNNLTDVFADSFVNGVVSANPGGPTQDANGNPLLSPPDTTGLATDVANATATKNLQIPDWDTEAASQPVRIVATSSQAAIVEYSQALGDVVNNHFNTQVQNIVGSSDSAAASDLSYVQSQMQSALGDTLALQTPKPLANFQKSLIKVLVYNKNITGLLNLAQTDPVKASLVFQAEDVKYQAAQDDLQTAAQEIASGTVSFEGGDAAPSALVSIVNQVLGIKEAHAQFAVFDAATYALIQANTVHNIAHQLEALIKNTILQIIKNTLIALIQRKVLSWVQGSGAPRFITNWGTTLINAYTQTALNAINSQFSCINGSFLPQINLTLGTFYKSTGNNFCANSFQAALGGHSLQQFYNNFANGGWLAFGVSSMPTNNYYGGLYFKAQAVGLNAQNAQQAITAQSVASQGAKGDQACSDGSNPGSIHYVCVAGVNPNSVTLPGTQYPPPCKPGDQQIAVANNGVCSNGTTPIGTTPGIFTVSTFGAGVDATPKQIAAANDIVGLLNSVVGSLLSGLANAAISAAGQGVNGLLSVQAGSIQGGGTNTVQPLPLACSPTSQTVSSTVGAFISASGGALDANSNPPTYTWLSSNGASSTGPFFSPILGIGTYTINLSDSTGDAPTMCSVTVQ